MPSDLKNKVSIITGAGSGIGAATAVHFAVSGSAVAICDMNEDSLEKTALNCIKAGLKEDQVLRVPGDVTVKADQEKIFRKTIEHFDRLDVLVNCAGIHRMTNHLDPDYLSLFEKVLDVNFKSVYQMIHLAIPHLKKTKGNIVNVSSSIAGRFTANVGAYSISKSGVDQITRAFAGDLGKYQIRVNSVLPGAVKTNIMINAGWSQEQQDSMMDQYGAAHVLERTAQPEEIAKPIAFLASEDASFITGVNLLVDGGITLHYGPSVALGDFK